VSARTYYMAAAGTTDKLILWARMGELNELGWACCFDWTPMDEPREHWPAVSKAEVDASVLCDVFVALTPVTVGVALEIGARLSRYGVVHVVGEWDHVPHSRHPLVRHHASWPAFLASLGGVP